MKKPEQFHTALDELQNEVISATIDLLEQHDNHIDIEEDEYGDRPSIVVWNSWNGSAEGQEFMGATLKDGVVTLHFEDNLTSIDIDQEASELTPGEMVEAYEHLYFAVN